MLDQIGAQNFFNQIHQMYIEPEINRRVSQGNLSENFTIRECLIRLPQTQPPIVEFNNEFGWYMKFKAAPKVEIIPEQAVYLHHIEKITQALPPKVNNERVSFIYLYWDGFGYQALFDFSPNQPDFDQNNDEFQLGEAIADHIRRKFIEMAVQVSLTAQAELRKIGLWTVTSLLPYPISKMVERIGGGDLEAARAILLEHCTPDYVEKLVETWKPISVFDERIAVFREAIFAHRDGKYHLSIYTLIPQIEGVITDWLYKVMQSADVKFKPESKIKQFQILIQTLTKLPYSYRESLNSISAFLLDGPALQVFKKWLDNVDTSFPGRHPIAHGRYDPSLFNEENSLKLFLLLDTVCQFMMFYEAEHNLLQ